MNRRLIALLLSLVMLFSLSGVSALGEAEQSIIVAEEQTAEETPAAEELPSEDIPAVKEPEADPAEPADEADGEAQTADAPAVSSEPENDGEEPETEVLEPLAGEDEITLPPQELTQKDATVTARLSRTTAVICPGDNWTTLQVIYSDESGEDGDGAARTVSFRSSNEKYVRVDENGKLTGVARGTATVTAEICYEGKTEQLKCAVKVLRAPSSVKATPANGHLNVGESGTYKVSFSSGYGASCRFESSDESVAVVDEFGVVTAVGKGSVKITARPFKGKAAVCSLVVYAPASEIILREESAVLGEGMTCALTPALPEYEKDTFTYTSSDPEAASVSANGVITANAVSDAPVTITVEAGSGVKAEFSATVLKGPETLTAGVSALTMGRGNTLDLVSAGIVAYAPQDSCTKLTFSSSNRKVVSVTEGGVIKALKNGTSVITVRTSNHLEATIKVTVMSYPSSMKLNVTSATLGTGMTGQLRVTFSRKSYSLYTFTSDNPDVASVDAATGLVTAKAPGTAVITCACVSGKRRASCKVTVLGAPQTISAKNAEIRAYVGKTNVRVAGAYPQGTMCAFTYTLIEGDCAEVDSATGLLTFLSEGTATVRITGNNTDSTVDCVIYVCPAPNELVIRESSITIGKGNTLDLVAGGVVSLVPENAQTDYRITTSSKKYVSVSGTSIKGARAGTAKITVTTQNNLTKVISVKVMNYPTTMRLSASTLRLSEGMTAKLGVVFSKNTYSLYRFTSSAPDIVSVDPQSGLVTVAENAAADGQKTVTITCACLSGTKKATCTVTVLPAPTGVEFDSESYILNAGDTLKTSATVADGVPATLSYSTSDESIVTIDANGVITGVETGTAYLTVTTHNGVSNAQTCAVTVRPRPESITPGQSEYTLGLGETAEITYTVLPEDAGSRYTLTSSAPGIVSVTQDGRIAAKGIGSAVITISANNSEASCAIAVTVKPYYEVHPAEIIAHRGASGNYPPGNTITAFSHAKAEGADSIELDVQRSKDGVLFVRHDTTIVVNGKTVGLSTLTYAQIKKLDKNVCTLKEALNCIAKYDVSIVIEMKVIGIESEVMSCAKSCGVHDRSMYASFSSTSLKKVKELDQSSTTVMFINTDDMIKAVQKSPNGYGFDIISVKYTKLTESFVRTMHLAGKKVGAWTIDAKTDLQKVKKLGVDSVTTNFPKNAK